MLLPLALASLAWASEWSESPIEPRYEYDFTAYTVPRGHVKIGLVNLDVGAMKNVHLGTAPILFVVGYYNAHAKVTAIQTERFDLSLFGGFGYINRTFGGEATADGGTTTAVPIKAWAWPFDATASVIAAEKISFHGGLRIERFEVQSQFELDTLAAGLGTLVGADLSESLANGLKDNGAVYGGAELAVFQPHLAVDFRFNRRDSLIYQWKTTAFLHARVDAGYTTQTDTVSVGAAAEVNTSLKDQALGTHSLSWQGSFKRWHLRFGIGKSAIPGGGILQATEISYILGKPVTAEAKPSP